MKKQMMRYILMGVLFVLPAQISATQTLTETQLAEDVFIEGIPENAELYVGEEMHIRGYVDDQATQKDITWQITGNNGIIEFNSAGNSASIVAKAPGTVWIMARATDGSDRAREYTIRIKPNPMEEDNQEITPPAEEEVNPPIEEETSPPSEGSVTPSVEEEITTPDGEVKPPVEEDIKVPNNEGTTEKPVTEDIIILGGTGGSLADPIIITLNKDLTSNQKIALMNRYLAELKVNYSLKLMNRKDHRQFTAYTLKVAEAKNDFFIEIRVEKEDQEAYIPIIEMLDDIEKETAQGINKDVVAQNDEIIKLQDPEHHTANLEKVSNQVGTQLEVVHPVSDSQQVEQGVDTVEAAHSANPLKEESIQVDTSQEVAHETKDGKGFKFGYLWVVLSLGAAFIIKNIF